MSERRLTILQTLPALDGGGVERGSLEVARELVRHGHRALVVSAGGRMVEELEALGGEHIAMPIGRKLPPPIELIWKLRRLLRRERVDILHARSRMPAWVVLAAWRGMKPAERPRFVTTVHGFNTPGRYSSVMVRGERVEVVSEAVRDFVLGHYPWVDPARLTLIHRGVDPAVYPHGFRPSDEWLSDWYGRYPELKGRKVICLPGRITRLKGHADLIRLLAALRERGIEAHGLIVGGEHKRHLSYLEEIKGLADELGVAVTFTGHRSDLREIHAVSDLVLSLSAKPESFGRTVLEALSVGTPVVGYEHGGVGEILARLFPEGRAPFGDAEALVERAAAFLEQPPEVAPVEAFTLQAMLDATLALYREVAVEGSGRG